jgi:hypothetical protein
MMFPEKGDNEAGYLFSVVYKPTSQKGSSIWGI